jgi:competence protein ComEC
MITIDIFTDVINAYFHEPYSSLMNGILFGIPIKLSGSFISELKRVGLMHLVVLSGMNITFLAAIVQNITSYLPKRISALLSIVTIIIFILFVGPQPPIVRAGITGVIGLMAIIYERRKLALYTLFISACLIGLFKTEWLSTVSFQLSFGATLGIILFGPHTESSKSSNRLLSFIKSDLHTSIAAQVFTAPIIFIYFKQISLIAPISNLLVSFTIAPLMIFGFVTSILGRMHPVLGIPTSVVSYGILFYIVKVISLLSSLPGVFIQF